MKSEGTTKRNRHVGMALAAMLMPVAAWPANVTWNGAAGDGEWGTAGNWSANAVPATNDTAILPHVGDGRIRLGADQTVGAFYFTGSNIILDGDGTHKLILTGSGMPNSASATVKTSYILADVVLSNNVSWSSPNMYGNNVACFGSITDQGRGHDITFTGSHNNNASIGGVVDVHGTIYVNPITVTLGYRWQDSGGAVYAGGSVTNAAGIYMDSQIHSSDSADTELIIDNTAVANTDRIAAGIPVGSVNTGGKITLKGNSTIDVVERISTLDLLAGKLHISVVGASSGTTNLTDFAVDTIQHRTGSILELSVSNKGRFVVAGAANTYGIWQPWCLMTNGRYTKVDASGAIVATVNGDYLAPSPAGNSANAIYRFADAELALEEDTAVYGLLWDRSSAQTLALGGYDLAIKSGTLPMTGNGAKIISSTGGALKFGGEDIIIYTMGSDTCEINAPMEWEKPAGSEVDYPALIFPNCGRVGGMFLNGEDRIGDYGPLHAHTFYSYNYNAVQGTGTLVFGGPSDRTFHGDITGVMALEKRGPGTLTLRGASKARKATLNVYEGCARLAHETPVKPTVHAGGACEIAGGITILNTHTPTINSGGMIMGDGSVAGGMTLNSGATVAGGGVGRVGCLTIGSGRWTDINLKDALTVALKIDTGTNSLVKVGQNLSFPSNASNPDAETTITIDVTDLSERQALLRDVVFTVLTWDALKNYNAGLVSFEVTTSMPNRIDTSNAVATFDTAARKLFVSGLRYVSQGTCFIVR